MVIGWAGIALAGVLVLVASTAGARRDDIHPAEAAAFRAINGLPDWLFVVLWLPMQLGNLVVGMLAGVAVGVAVGSVGIALGAVAMAGLKLVVERQIRRRMAAWLPVRQRPGTSEPGAVVRGGDVPRSGPSFPSGHVILAAGVACIVATAVPWHATLVAVVLAASVGIGRIFVGAHNPLDVTCGLGAGLALGGAIAAVLVAT